MTTATQRREELFEQFRMLTPPYLNPAEKMARHADTVAEVASLNLTEADVPILGEMIRMYESLNWQSKEYDNDFGLPVLAARALASMPGLDGLDEVLALLEPMDRWDDDVLTEDMGVTLAAFGREALPRLEAYLLEDHRLWAYATVIRAITEMVKAEPDLRDQGIDLLVRRLERMADNDPDLNAQLVSGLLELKAKEAAGVIERAYAAECVEVQSSGNWNAVKEELGVPGTGLVPDDVASQNAGFGRNSWALQERMAELDRELAEKKRLLAEAQRRARKKKRASLDRKRTKRPRKSR